MNRVIERTDTVLRDSAYYAVSSNQAGVPSQSMRKMIQTLCSNSSTVNSGYNDDIEHAENLNKADKILKAS